jgi:hypothetical protein
METKKRVRGPKIAKLTSVARCGVEIGKLYRLMRRGDLGTCDGLRMVQALLGLKACLETSEIERQVAEIKAALANSSMARRPLLAAVMPNSKVS